MAKQQQQIKMGAYFLNGRRYNNTSGSYASEFTPFNGYPASYDVWNVNYRAEKEYLTSATTRSLTAYERSNPSGYRIKIDISLRNTTSSQSAAIEDLLSLTSSQYRRTVVETTLSSSPVTGSSIDLNLGATSPNTTDNVYQGAYIYNASNTSSNVYRISSYVGSTTTAVAPETIVGYGTGDVVNVSLYRNKPTLIGVSVDNTTSNIVFCNFVEGSFGIERELTIGNQIINMQLTSVDWYNEIPSYLNI